ncbi:uncharacterized protein LOC131852624 [Achroia grisella]|uniref:uncharacterized protein LOC131852624 n=1 Tax=Achroia grisella TaxID=688607 RepID=UPI0027D2CA36|nr:uncharacterized protein LOC131852624 [Achroia grisella]
MANLEDIAETQRSLEVTLFQRMQEFEVQLKASKEGSSQQGSISDISRAFLSFKEQAWGIFNILQKQIEELTNSVDGIEMRHRRKSLLLNGVPENTEENVTATALDIIHKNLKLTDIKAADIRECHRLGSVNANRTRPVLIKFSDVSCKSAVWKNKTMLKGSCYVLAEFLTRRRQSLFIAARKHFGIRKVWTMDGIITVQMPNGNRSRISSSKELENLVAEFGSAASTRGASKDTPVSTSQADSNKAVRAKRGVRLK